MKEKIIIKHYIETDEKTIPMESLSEKEKVRISLLLQDTFMETLGYRRRKNTE